MKCRHLRCDLLYLTCLSVLNEFELFLRIVFGLRSGLENFGWGLDLDDSDSMVVGFKIKVNLKAVKPIKLMHLPTYILP